MSTEELSFDKGMRSFTNRWVALVIDICLVLAISLALNILTPLRIGWPMVISLFIILNIVLPVLFFGGITLGRKVGRLYFVYPDTCTGNKKIVMLFLREIIRLVSIIITAGFIMPLTAILTAENSKPALHEKISGVRVKIKPNKNETKVNDDFNGKFNL